MNFYSFEEIRQAGDCIQFVSTVLGLEINRDGRCQATWRGGDGYNVDVKAHEWYDHRAKVGGGIMELCMAAKFPDDIQQAQNFLGDWLKLVPKMTRQKGPMVSARLDELLADGYTETKRYGYINLDGDLVHFVARLEHPTKHKEFLQGTPNGWGLRDTAPILYRQADWIHGDYVCVVEGEKDADTLIDRLGIPATTNCGGADKWRPEYAAEFKGKTVVILRDNDEAGEAHALRVSRELKDVATRIIVLCLSSQPKGDVTDWVNDEGGDAAKLVELMQSTTPVDATELEPIDLLVEEAKLANQKDLYNYTEYKTKVGKKTESVRTPRQINDLIKDVHKRFAGFPRKVGDSKYMFDHDHDSGRITYIEKPSSLFSWIARKSKRVCVWARGDGLVEKSEIFEGLLAEATRYEAISYVPDWPKRLDVYYAHTKLPAPSEGFKFFYDFVEMFNPTDEDNMTLLRAFICAPLWYIEGIPRPSWLFDSTEGAGVGKTTCVELIAKLYGGTPIKTNRQELKSDFGELTKRVVSTAGRIARILLCDNVVGRFESPELSDMMTAESISGKAPYGRGEESRPNNLTYVITSNAASLDNDLSDRSIIVKFKKAKRSAIWKTNILMYIENNRLQIIADIIALLESAAPMRSEPRTRFPEFEQTILRAVCRSDEEYDKAIETILSSRSNANVDAEYASRAEEEFQTFMLREQYLNVQPGQENIFIQGRLAEQWMREIFTHEELSGNLMQQLRGFAMNGHSTKFYAKVERQFVGPVGARRQLRGILWIGNPDEDPRDVTKAIGLKGKQVVEL